MAMVYPGVIGSVLGFALYYYVLQHMETTRVALVTPVLALLLGHLFNGASNGARVWFGTITIPGGLLLFEYGDRLLVRLPRSSVSTGLNR